MTKIKTQNILLTLAAFAALIFLLPADKDIPGVQSGNSQFNSAGPTGTQKTHQQQSIIRGHFLHSA
ncbi:MAG: hypothetical protein CTY19_04360 [Methylomonas sp.]|jgi:hypothetical protein|nr:MAG: hypothetical protein CTY19_04360 [Methylomonas sp.]